MDASALPSFIPVGPANLKEKIYTQVGPDLARIEEEINRLLDSDIPLISVVGRYITGSGGKRLRPLLMILASRLCGYKGRDDVRLAVVFEFVHAATLLHDDVVDHAEFRRSCPAANTVWGNPAVVLVGDFLYSRSIQIAVGYQDIRILQVLLDATTSMSEGEVLQLINSDNLEISESEYLEVINRKTATLISASCQTGAIFGGGGAGEEKALKAYGQNLGIAFQLIDDTLDFTGEAEELGKPVGNDLQEGKATLPLIYALKNAKAAERLRLRQIFTSEKIPPEMITEITDIVARSGGIEYTTGQACVHAMRAKEALRIFPESPAKDILLDIADYVTCRRT
ncbi:MAG: polyprenyl synthetase family protein [Deltaproteobacteria bacterium]|nr:polyprenyl synthetase family protein [Deltaproteobacteria bacterium]MDA8307057.1 polyprenyl synthetase family protein [Deltaproteobacteria bacterium]